MSLRLASHQYGVPVRTLRRHRDKNVLCPGSVKVAKVTRGEHGVHVTAICALNAIQQCQKCGQWARFSCSPGEATYICCN